MARAGLMCGEGTREPGGELPAVGRPMGWCGRDTIGSDRGSSDRRCMVLAFWAPFGGRAKTIGRKEGEGPDDSGFCFEKTENTLCLSCNALPDAGPVPRPALLPRTSPFPLPRRSLPQNSVCKPCRQLFVFPCSLFRELFFRRSPRHGSTRAR